MSVFQSSPFYDASTVNEEDLSLVTSVPISNAVRPPPPTKAPVLNPNVVGFPYTPSEAYNPGKGKYKSNQGQLRVKVLSWNLGDNRLTQDLWTQEIQKSWQIITMRDYDILGICLQEDSRGKFGKFGEAVADVLKDEFTMVSNSVEGPPELTKKAFSVRAFIYTRKNNKDVFPSASPTVRKNDVCLNRAVYCTKATAGVSIISNTPTGEIMQFTLMSSHLPIDTSTKDLGYQARLKAIETSMKDVYDKLEDTTITKRLAVWAGDLNFRDNTPVTPTGKPFSDQLTYAISTHKEEYFRDFIAPAVDFPPTCKLVTCDKKTCPRCRVNSGEVFSKSCYDTHGGSGKLAEREPSHCDRILYRPDGVTGEVAEYKSWGDSKAVASSDHNLVYATFVIFY